MKPFVFVINVNLYNNKLFSVKKDKYMLILRLIDS